MDTKKLRQRILDLAIRGKLVPQDPTDEPATVLLDRIRSEKERLIAEGKIKRPKAQKNASDTPHYHDFTPPFAIPSTWEWVTIKEICSKIGSGSTPKGSNYSVDGIPFFRSQNVYNEGLVYNDIKYISEEIHTSMIGTEVIAKDLLLNITGGSLGRCAVVPNDFVKGNVSQHVCILRPVLVIPEYVHCLILSSDFAKSMNLTGSGREGLPKYNLEIMNFPLPPLSEQKRIVSAVNVFIKYLNAIDFEKLHLEDLMSSAKSKILELAITGKLVPQNPDDEPAAELLKRINPDAKIVTDNRHYPQLPEGWCVCRLEDIVDFEQPQKYIVSSTDYSNDYDIPVLTAGKSFIIGYTDETFGVYNTLPVIIFDDFTTESKFVDFAFKVKSSAMKILTVKKPIIPQFIHAFMRITHLIGDTHKRYWISEYSKLHIMLPPLEEQERIVQTVMSFESTLEEIKSLLESD